MLTLVSVSGVVSLSKRSRYQMDGIVAATDLVECFVWFGLVIYFIKDVKTLVTNYVGESNLVFIIYRGVVLNCR